MIIVDRSYSRSTNYNVLLIPQVMVLMKTYIHGSPLSKVQIPYNRLLSVGTSIIAASYMLRKPAMGGDHCHNSTRARFSYSGRAISYSGRAVSYLGGAISYLGGAISLQLRNSTLGKNVLLQLRYRHDTS